MPRKPARRSGRVTLRLTPELHEELAQVRLELEVDHYLRRVEAERQSQLKLTDQEADEARVALPDLL